MELKKLHKKATEVKRRRWDLLRGQDEAVSSQVCFPFYFDVSSGLHLVPDYVSFVTCITCFC